MIKTSTVTSVLHIPENTSVYVHIHALEHSLKVCLCTCVCTPCHGTGVMVRGQIEGIGSSINHVRTQVLNLGHWASQQAILIASPLLYLKPSLTGIPCQI